MAISNIIIIILGPIIQSMINTQIKKGCYAISTVSQGGRLKHYRVYHKPNLDYLIGKIECDSLNTIVTKYAKELYLKTPCPGSPFQDLFNTRKNVSAGYLVPELE